MAVPGNTCWGAGQPLSFSRVAPLSLAGTGGGPPCVHGVRLAWLFGERWPSPRPPLPGLWLEPGAPLELTVPPASVSKEPALQRPARRARGWLLLMRSSCALCACVAQPGLVAGPLPRDPAVTLPAGSHGKAPFSLRGVGDDIVTRKENNVKA